MEVVTRLNALVEATGAEARLLAFAFSTCLALQYLLARFVQLLFTQLQATGIFDRVALDDAHHRLEPDVAQTLVQSNEVFDLGVGHLRSRLIHLVGTSF